MFWLTTWCFFQTLDDIEDVSPEYLFESVVPPNSTQPTDYSFCMEPQNLRYETTHSLDELISDVNENELLAFRWVKWSSLDTFQLVLALFYDSLEVGDMNNLI